MKRYENFLKVTKNEDVFFIAIRCTGDEEKDAVNQNIIEKDILGGSAIVENVVQIESINEQQRFSFYPSIGPCFDCITPKAIDEDAFVERNFDFIEEYQLL